MKPTRLAATALAVVGAYLSPRLALDATLPKPLFSDLNTKNFATKKGEIVTAVLAASKGKLRRGVAMDDGGGLAKLLDALEDSTKGADESVSEKQHEAMEAAAQGNSEIGIPKAVGEEFVDRDTGKKKPGMDGEAVKEWLRGKGMGEDDLAEFDTTFPPAVAGQDEDDDEDEEKKKAAAKLKEAEDSMKNMVTKPAMDAALKAHGETVAKQVRDNERGIRVACATVKDWIGEVPASLAFDSASDVYRHALGALGVESAKTLHADALLPVLQAQAKPGAKPSVHLTTPALGMDEAARNSMKAVLGDINLDRIGTA